MNGKSSAVPSTMDLYVTHLDHVGPYLKVYGQLNRDATLLLSKRIEQLMPTCFSIEPGWSLARQQALLSPGIFCVYKSVHGAAPGDVEYMRTRVLNASIEEPSKQLNQMRVEIEFLDYGYQRTVDSHNLLFPKQPLLLQNVPILSSQYIMLGICAGWEKAELDEVQQLVANQTVKISIQQEICGQKFVTLHWKDFDLAEFLVQQKKIGAPIANQLLLDHCKKLWKDAPQSPVNDNNNSYYNNNNLQSNLKSPTDLAREQLAARRSLSARLEQQRRSSPVVPRQLNMPSDSKEAPPAYTPLANVTNVMPAAVLAHLQKPLPSAPYPYMPKSQPRPPNMLYNPRMSKIMVQPQIYKPPMPLQITPAYLSAPRPAFTPYVAPAHKSAAPPQQCVMPAFKTTSLTVGLTFDVYVSYVENGPHLFWVQLKTSQLGLSDMMRRIEETQLQPLTQPPDVGTACVARFSEDRHYYRALISACFPNKFRVVYVDYGNSELVLIQDLYHIPPELLQIKPYAFRFGLAGSKELEPIDESMKRIFKSTALYANFQLTVQPAESVGSMQTCHLAREGQSMLDVLRKMKNSQQAYIKADQLQNEDAVEIRYIDSPSNFYVQKVDNIKQFEQLMDEMFAYYNTNQMVPDQLVLGAPCIVKCDQEWYRAEILRVDGAAIIVRHVDFGYEQNVKKHLIGIIAEKHLEMPRQAIKCCLKGFENSDFSQDSITDQFEMLAEESNIRRRTFSVRVFRIEPDGLNVVNLLAKNLNVMKKLYKLSMPFDQFLSLEKAQFNNSAANTTRAPSLNSASIATAEVAPLEKVGNILNSTTVESLDRMQLQGRNKSQEWENQARNKSQEWDKHSSASSKDNQARNKSQEWDKHSSASSNNKDHKEQQDNNQRQAGGNKRQAERKQPPAQQPQPQRVERQALMDLSFESQSTSSYTSTSMGSPRKGNRKNGRQAQASPRLQNGKPEANKNTRFSESSQSSRNKEQRQSPRSQNAPQGFAQKPQRQKSTLDGSAVSKRSSGGESDSAAVEKYAPLDKALPVLAIKTPSKEAASLSWWVSPFQFYVVPKSMANKYERLLREMQQFYKQKPHQPLQLKVGSSVVVRQRRGGNIMRAIVDGCNHMLRRYRVFCVDTGIMTTVTSEDVWQLEQRFAEMPCLAYRCSFDGVVANYDHLYIVDRMEKFVPTNAKIECEFLAQQLARNNAYIVHMQVNGAASLKDLLVKANFLTEVPPEVRVGLLEGQQFRGKFTSIRDMTNFKIQLECCSSVNFLASYDDAKFVKANPGLSEPFKQHYEGKSFAFNVKNVCENNIIHLSPIMPLFKHDRSDFICNYPIVFTTFAATVVYTAKPFRFYVQPSAVEAAMKKLLDDMYAHYEHKGKPLTKFEEDRICAARSSDGNWYRARVLAKAGSSSKIEVFYMDYGNSEQLSRKDIKVLEDKFYVDQSSYGVEINLPLGRASLNDDKIKARLAELLEEQLVTIKPIEVRRSHLIADVLLPNKQSVLDVLKSEKLIAGRDLEFMRKQLDKEPGFELYDTVDLTTDDDEERKTEASKSSSANSSPRAKKQPKETKQKEAAKPTEKVLKPPTPTLPPAPAVPEPAPAPVAIMEQPKVVDVVPEPSPSPIVNEVSEPKVVETALDPYRDMDTVVLSHCDNPAQFYVHAIDKLEALNRLQENLQIVSPSLPQLMNVVNGAQCISLYSVDKQWYRAKIIDAELMVLEFIDFGNTDCVSDTSDVKESMWVHIEPFCAPWALPICPKGTADWVDAANAIFNDSYTKVLHYEYLTRGDFSKRSYVQLYIEGVDVTKKLIADGYAKPLEYVSSGSTCYVSHVNSICDFYIQLERDCKALELIEMYLRDAEEHLELLQRFEKKLIVAALFEDDELWYRAELLRQLPDGRYEVRFIDYGNTSATSRCLLLSEEIAQLPSLSKKCALQLPEDYEEWSAAAEAKFAEITGEGELVFTTELLRPGSDYVTIQLLLDEDNVSDKLLPLCTRKHKEEEAPKEVATVVANGGAGQTKGILTHVDSPSQFYLQFEESAGIIDGIAEKLNGGLELKLLAEGKVGDLCVTLFKDEHNEYYRARVLAKEEGQYRVFFIDYGNQAMADELFALPAELAEIPPMAAVYALEHCEKFAKYAKLASEAMDTLVDGCNGEVAIELVDKAATPPVVRLTLGQNQLDIGEQLQKILEAKIKAGEETADHSPKSFYKQLRKHSDELDQLLETLQKPGEENAKCVISHGHSPRSFYVQLKKHSDQLDLILKTLKQLKSNQQQLQPLLAATESLKGVCYSQEDDCYYRCCIKQVLGEGFELFLIDHGNTIVAPQVFKLPEEIAEIAPLALHCRLSDIPEGVDNAKLEEAFAALLESHFGEVYEIVSEVKDEEQRSVQLRINYKNFAEELTNAVAGIEKPVIAELHNCVVVQFDAPNSFYVQMEQDVPALEQLTDKLLDAEEQLPVFSELEVGARCVAQYPEDEVYYRAEIVKLEAEPGKCEVHFIDFGNNAVTDKLRQLPQDLAQPPRYSKHCELEAAAIAKCDAAELQAFIDTRCSETFQVEILATKGDTQVVRLFYQSTNISEKLRQSDK